MHIANKNPEERRTGLKRGVNMDKTFRLYFNNKQIDADLLDRIPKSQKNKLRNFCSSILNRITCQESEDEIFFHDFDSITSNSRFCAEE